MRRILADIGELLAAAVVGLCVAAVTVLGTLAVALATGTAAVPGVISAWRDTDVHGLAFIPQGAGIAIVVLFAAVAYLAIRIRLLRARRYPAT